MRLLLATIVFTSLPVSLLATNKDSLKVEKSEGLMRQSVSAAPSITDEVDVRFKPYIGMGVGTLTFFGDISNNHKGFHFTVSRLATELRVTHPITSYLDLQFHTMFGRVSGNERSLTNNARNLNFESRIRAGGAGVSYNFDHLLKPDREIDPFVYVGIESFEFLSKTDLFDQHGNRYHYWSDGSIMNLDENDPNASNAIRVYRDYVYETDLREQNLDSLGKYPERSWALPIGIGFDFHITDYFRLRLASTMHFSFTDLIDNVTGESGGGRAGTKGNDKFLYTNFTLSYNLHPLPKNSEDELEDLVDPWLVPEFALDTFDTDFDGVVDHQDVCPYTPKDCQPVEVTGCADDEDGDGVPDCRDKELGSAGPYVDEDGVTITDEMIELAYKRYKDSTGEYSEIEVVTKETVFGESAIGAVAANKTANPLGDKDKHYVIVLDKKKYNVSANDLSDKLMYKNFSTIREGDSVYFVLDNLTLAEAGLVAKELEKKGIVASGDIDIGEKQLDKDGKVIVAHVTQIEIDEAMKDGGTVPHLPETDEIIYRVQIGAYSNEQNLKTFLGLPDLVQLKGKDGYFRYFSGAFYDLNEASRHKVIMTSEAGFGGAFVVAYKNGKRISLNEVTEVKDGYDEKIDDYNDKVGGNVEWHYTVQVGAYQGTIPTEMIDLYLELGKDQPLETIEEDGGLTRYVLGKYKTEDDARAALEGLQENGLPDAFVIINKAGELIRLEDAGDLIKGDN